MKPIVRLFPAVVAAGAAVLLAACSPTHIPLDMGMGAAPAPRVVVPTAPLTAFERDFVTKVAAKGLYEVEVSRLAVDKAQSPVIREFAQGMVLHHTQMNNELLALMSAHRIPTPRGLTADKAAKLQRLAAVPRSDAFDNGYIRVVGIEDHRTAIVMFENARGRIRDADLRSYVDRSLTVLRAHLAAAQNAAATLAG